MTLYAVGDLQGCLSPLKQLMEQIAFDPSKDKIWFVGDLVNRGPDSLGCLRFVRSLGDSAVTVLGNHDLHLLAVYYSGASLKRKDTLKEILEAPDCDALMEWLVRQPLLHYDKRRDTALVHAGVPHVWTVRKAIGLAEEVHDQLMDPVGRRLFFEQMYGNEPEGWHDALEGQDRLRVITNYLTRMRFVSQDGRLELNAKNEPENAPEGYAPWYTFSRQDETRIVFGHWAALMGRTHSDRFVALDTGCVWGGELTLRNLETGQTFTAPEPAILRTSP